MLKAAIEEKFEKIFAGLSQKGDMKEKEKVIAKCFALHARPTPLLCYDCNKQRVNYMKKNKNSYVCLASLSEEK